MDMQNVAKLNIPEGEVGTIHDKDGNLIWGKVSYGVKYKGNTTQQTYTGKNLTPYPYSSSTLTVNGITIENNNNGSVTINGSITSSTGSNVSFYLVNGSFTLSAGTYYVVPIPGAVSTGAHYTLYDGSQYTVLSSSNNWSFTLSAQKTFTQFYIEIYRSYTGSFSNTTLFPMLSTLPGQTSADFEPYVGGIPAPNPDYPQTVNTVTGEQTISINGAAHAVNLGSIELCKIGTYQDYIYKDGSDWKIHKEIGAKTYTGESSENWQYFSYGVYTLWRSTSVPTGMLASAITTDSFKSNNFTYWVNDGTSVSIGVTEGHFGFNGTATNINFKYASLESTLSDWTTWLSTHNTTVYYPLANPTDTTITNAALIAQLEAVEQWLTRYGYDATVSGNLPIVIDRTAL